MPVSGCLVSLVCLATVRIVIPTLLQFFTRVLPAVGAVLYSFFEPTLPGGTVGRPLKITLPWHSSQTTSAGEYFSSPEENISVTSKIFTESLY